MRSIFRNMFVRVSVLAAVVFLAVTFVILQLRLNDLSAEKDGLKEQISRQTEKNNELQAEIDRPFDAEYVAEIAHEKLGLRFPQEIVFYSGDNN